MNLVVNDYYPLSQTKRVKVKLIQEIIFMKLLLIYIVQFIERTIKTLSYLLSVSSVFPCSFAHAVKIAWLKPILALSLE